MGNHEWCVACHESDFHYGQPCDPERRAKVLAEQEEARKRKVRGIIELKRIIEVLKANGIEPKNTYKKSFLQEHVEYPKIEIMFYDVVK